MGKTRPFTVAIAAVSGGGKTTIACELTKSIKQATSLYFDEYQFEKAPLNLVEWVNKGADYNEWDLTPLVEDIKKLQSASAEKLSYIFLDYPFAYENEQMKNYIDLAIFIDTPLDIAMGRRILRDYKEHEDIKNIHNEILVYLKSGRTAYLEMIKNIKPNSDIVIDGTLPLELIVQKILGLLKRKRNLIS